MAADFSDPAWWPKPPPKPPKPISLPKVLFGTLVPILAVALVVTLIVMQKSGSPASGAAGRSATAFEACLKSQGVLSVSGGANPRELQQAAESCRSHLPPGVRLPDFNRPPSDSSDGTAQEAFQQCMQTAEAAIPRSRSGFGSSSKARQAFEDAVTMCRSLSQTSGGTQTAPITTTAPSTA